jgi:diguanylate cyclase (GGDEF)-like protein
MIRKSDLAFRYGGEEFLIVLPETGLEEANEKAEAICQAVRELSIEWNEGKLVNVTISGGVSNYPLHSITSTELIRKADHAMYNAKESGRNRICVYSSDN